MGLLFLCECQSIHHKLEAPFVRLLEVYAGIEIPAAGGSIAQEWRFLLCLISSKTDPMCLLSVLRYSGTIIFIFAPFSEVRGIFDSPSIVYIYMPDIIPRTMQYAKYGMILPDQYIGGTVPAKSTV